MADGLKLGDLFFDVGIQGSEKSQGLIKGLRQGISDTASVSLEAKAAILGAIYALNQLFSASSQRGTELNQFNHLVDSGAETLQRYQHAARQAGVANADVAKSFFNLRDIATKAFQKGELPEGWKHIQFTTGMSTEDLRKMQEFPEHGFKFFQEYAQREKNKGLRDSALESFGFSRAMIAAFSQNKFTPEVLGQADVYSKREIESQARAGVAWSNLFNKVEMSVGRLNAKYGEDIVNNITKIVDALLKLSESLIKLADSAKLAEKIETVVKGITGAIDTANTLIDQKQGVKQLGPVFDKKDINPFAAPPKTKSEWVEQKIVGASAEAFSTSEYMRALVFMLFGMQKAREAGGKVSDKASKAATATGNAADSAFISTMGSDQLEQKTMQAVLAGGLKDFAVPLWILDRMFKEIIRGQDQTVSPNIAPAVPDTKSIITPKVSSPSGAQQPPVNDNRVFQQTNNFNHPDADPQRIGSEVGRASKDAFQSSPARVWGN